jgi:hypothetical protein
VYATHGHHPYYLISDIISVRTGVTFKKNLKHLQFLVHWDRLQN